MSDTSTSRLHNLIDVLNTHIHTLQNKQKLLLQKEKEKEESPSKSKSAQKKIRRSKKDVGSTIELLQYVSDQILSALGETLSVNSQLVDPSSADAAVIKADLVFNLAPDFDIDIDSSSHLEFRSTSMDENEVDPEALELITKPRCLLISDGFVMCCLDLKQQRSSRYESIDEVPPLPKTGTPLKLLLEERYPVMVGLFKLGCDAYMIGGQHLSGYPDPSTVRASRERLEPWGVGLYSFLASKHGTKASSRDTYLLSKAAADDSTLSLSSECNIPPLNKPKVWPVVEKIGGLIHVFDSSPRWLDASVFFLNSGEFSHEVLNPNDVGKGWTDIPTALLIEDVRCYQSHLVVGDHIYLLASNRLFIFDSRAGIWEMHPECRTSSRYRSIRIQQVWYILEYGGGRCLGEFLHHGEPNEPLYMVIAILGTDFTDIDDDDLKVGAVAYLASSTGRVLCFQRLPHFFEGEPRLLKVCTVFNVDEQEMCSVVTADMMFGMDFEVDFLLINTFVAEAVPDAGAKVRDIWEKAACTTNYVPVELEFVRVVVKERYVYKTDTELEEKGDLTTFPRVQACCL